MSVATHIFSLVWLLYLAATTRYAVQMFQQNSYRTERYNRWLRQTGEWHSHMNIVALLAAVCFAFTTHLAAIAIFGVWMTIIAVAEFSIKYKVRLVYTMRVKRLIATRMLLTAAIIGVVHIYAVEYTLVAAMLLTLDYWTILSNWINRPLEAAITRWYYNDARRILRSMPILRL